MGANFTIGWDLGGAHLKAAILDVFDPIAPISSTIRQIDAYLATGKFPSLVRR